MKGFTIFDTPVGPCGIAWNDTAIVSVQLPERDEERTRARMRRLHPDATEAAAPQTVRNAIAAITSLLRGESEDLSSIDLDMSGVPPFHRRVYEAARAIPPGSTCSYGELAKRIGQPHAARAVGQALGRNPFVIVVPCHRVLAAGGKSGGFSAPGGVATKRRLLEIEGAALAPAKLF